MSTINRDPAPHPPAPASADEQAEKALALMIDALRLIDSSEGANVAGAHLDLAIHRLREWIDAPAPK